MTFVNIGSSVFVVKDVDLTEYKIEIWVRESSTFEVQLSFRLLVIFSGPIIQLATCNKISEHLK